MNPKAASLLARALLAADLLEPFGAEICASGPLPLTAAQPCFSYPFRSFERFLDHPLNQYRNRCHAPSPAPAQGSRGSFRVEC